MVRLPEILVEEERETHDKACQLAVNNILSEIYNDAGQSNSSILIAPDGSEMVCLFLVRLLSFLCF